METHTIPPVRGEYKTYGEAEQAARTLANHLRCSVGVEKPTAYQGWTTKLLPRPEHRQGYELRIECVDPDPVG